MRRSIPLVLIVILAVSAAAAPPEVDRASLVRSVLAALDHDIERETIVAIVAAQAQTAAGPAALAAPSIDGTDAAARIAFERELMSRVVATIRSYVRSPAFANEILRPWVEAFPTEELEMLAGMTRSPAGRRVLWRIFRLESHAMGAVSQRLERELASAFLQAGGGDVTLSARIRRTAADLRMIATALESYAVVSGRYPAARVVADLKSHLEPIYIRRLPENDAWGGPIHYVVSADGQHYRLISGGADGVVEPGNWLLDLSRRHAVWGDEPTSDLVFQDGQFLVAPASLRASAAPVRHGRVVGSVGGVMNATPDPRPLPAGFERVGGDVRAPRVLRRVEPRYPNEARQARVSGVVIVEVEVDATGRVGAVRVLKTLPLGLGEAAAEAVRQWEFEPAMKAGVPVPVVFNVMVAFRLDDVPAP